MNPSLYSPQQEENIHIHRQVRTWLRSGLINDSQITTILDYTNPDVRQTNVFFRIILFAFTCLCIGALLGLFIWSTKIEGKMTLAYALMIAGIISYFLAEQAVTKYRFYRHGIEEALAIASMVLFCWGITGAISLSSGMYSTHPLTIIACILFVVSALWLYLRFGYLYAIFISSIAACTIPFQLSLTPTNERIILLIILCLILLLNVIYDKPENEDFKKERNSILQACLLAAIYLTINLRILSLPAVITSAAGALEPNPKMFPPYIYWSSYILTFIIPVAGIYWGIQSRKRLILNTSLVMACITLATNKSYLGWTRYTWDPALLGTALVIISIIIHRWLNSGTNKIRDGFTAENILKPESHGISLAEVAAALTPMATDINIQQQLSQQDKLFDGGTSGGGGASREF